MILDNIFAISPQQLDIIAEKIYQNECACKREYLVWWSENEEFPSLGIGHFLWLPNNLNVPFDPSFKKFLDVCVYDDIEIPEVLKNYNKGCIWNNRNEYLDPKSADQIEQIKIWLENTKDIQAQFLYQRALNMLEDIIDYDPATRIDIEKLFALDIGKFAVIDYINFKGSGLNFTERYGHHGWGLLQVLQNMKFNPDPVDAFIKSAIEVLKMRIKAAPPERNEKVFLNSWIKRFESYRKF
ncbi:MAG: hypothetical protein PF638_07840 [Candidatus Delongbacteria bacterium]|jgi:hypothetical protein|nr:hypothetical protein [Candidatus Delongbacteria bacterium]